MVYLPVGTVCPLVDRFHGELKQPHKPDGVAPSTSEATPPAERQVFDGGVHHLPRAILSRLTLTLNRCPRELVHKPVSSP